MALWQVQRRKAAAPMRMMMAKPSTMIDLGSCPDCSFADILKEAPLITDPLVEVRACTDATFQTVALERDDAGELEEFIVNLNAHTPQQREGQPSAWAHSRTALEEKCATLAAQAQPDPALGTPQ